MVQVVSSVRPEVHYRDHAQAAERSADDHCASGCCAAAPEGEDASCAVEKACCAAEVGSYCLLGCCDCRCVSEVVVVFFAVSLRV